MCHKGEKNQDGPRSHPAGGLSGPQQSQHPETCHGAGEPAHTDVSQNQHTGSPPPDGKKLCVLSCTSWLSCSALNEAFLSVGYPFGGITYQFVGKMTPFLIVAVLVVLEGGKVRFALASSKGEN